MHVNCADVVYKAMGELIQVLYQLTNKRDGKQWLLLIKLFLFKQQNFCLTVCCEFGAQTMVFDLKRSNELIDLLAKMARFQLDQFLSY